MPRDAHETADTDWRHHDLTDQVLFGQDLRGKKLYGAKVSLTCATFDGVKLDRQQVALLLLMLSLADIEPTWQRGLHTLVEASIGRDEYDVLKRYLDLA